MSVVLLRRNRKEQDVERIDEESLQNFPPEEPSPDSEEEQELLLWLYYVDEFGYE